MTAQLTEGCLKPHPFLENCSPDFLNHLEEFATDVEFAPGQIILHENDYADRFYLICEGKIALESDSTGDRTIAIQTLGSGDILGSSWLFPPFTWHLSARTLEPCKAIALNAAALLIRAEQDPVFGYELMKRISRQVVRRLHATRKRLLHEIKSRQDWDAI
jgi:CRP/FNR family transcriptional regulator, cyclic AMP receptor protein